MRLGMESEGMRACVPGALFAMSLDIMSVQGSALPPANLKYFFAPKRSKKVEICRIGQV